jgi:hypothetical protein
VGAKRRSTRLALAIPVTVSWLGPQTEPLLEKTATVSINCHGCQYFSRFAPQRNSKLTVQVLHNKEVGESTEVQLRARVAWSRKSRRLAGLSQVGVEFDTPQNLWKVADPPEDWGFFSPGTKVEPASLLAEVRRLLHLARTGTHYQLLGLQPHPDPAEVRRRFHLLARKFHPDLHMNLPEFAPLLQALMDALTTAYKVLLSDESKARYDAEALPQPGQEHREPDRWARQCLEKVRECLVQKNCIGSILWLRRAIENEPHCSSHRAMLAQSLAQFPEYRQEAVEQFEKAIELDSSNLTAHLLYARMLEKMLVAWRARPHYIRVLELDRNHQEARARLNLLDAAAPRRVLRSSFLGRLTNRLSR